FHLPGEEGSEELVLRREVLVDALAGAAGRPGDVVHRRPGGAMEGDPLLSIRPGWAGSGANPTATSPATGIRPPRQGVRAGVQRAAAGGRFVARARQRGCAGAAALAT